MVTRLLKGLAPVAVVALAAGLASCDTQATVFNGPQGKPLSEIDLTGTAPTGIVLAGPDSLIVTRGDALSVDVDGDPEIVEAMRFELEDGTLAVMREKGAWNSRGKATVRVTLPTLSKMTLAGSGTIDAEAMTGNSAVTIAGSGTAKLARIDAEDLDVTIAGSGTFTGAGVSQKLNLTLAGSGSAAMARLDTGAADVTVAGSGDAAFASDGAVKATIMGSGEVAVTGNATCSVKSMGSGTLRCNGRAMNDPAE